MATSTLNTLQLVDYARTYGWTSPVLGIAGYSQQPALTFANDVMQEILAKPNAWKWNSQPVPPININPYQQDYPTSISQNTMGWIESCTQLDVNNLTQMPPTQLYVAAVDRLQPTFICGIASKICWIANAVAQTGTWPGPDVTYTNPLASQGGGPNNNSKTAITDTNGNIQSVTTYGTTGSTQPTWPMAGAAPGTQTIDGTVVWTLIDPNGVCFRIDRQSTANAQVWQLNAIYQVKPPPITTLNQSFAPIPDDLGYLVKQGFLTYCYKQGDVKQRALFKEEYQQWLIDIGEAMGASDREDQEYGFAPTQPIQGGVGSGGGMGGYGYPGWPGWQ